jgi:hypothetical protein
MEPNPYQAPLASAEIRPTRREREERHNVIYLVLVLAFLLVLFVLCTLPAIFVTI